MKAAMRTKYFHLFQPVDTKRRHLKPIASALIFAIAVFGTAATYASTTSSANVFVDFSTVGPPTSPLSVGSTISTYAGSGTNLIKGPQKALWQRYLTELGPLVWRVPLYYHDGQVGSSAGGVHSGDEGRAYIQGIKAIHGTPMIVVGGTTGDNDIQASDAEALVHYFNDKGGQNGGPVDRYVIGNEPDNGFGVDNYINGGAGSSGFHDIVTAMRNATVRTLTLAGPAFTTWASYKYADFETFFAADHSDVDVVDFHKYGAGDPINNISLTDQYEQGVQWIRQQVNSSFGTRADKIGIQVGEYNYNPFYSSAWQNAFYTSLNLVHTASVIGHVLSAGGRAYQYSDNDGALGLITDGTGNNDQPAGSYVRLPVYWGITVWTGGTQMPRYGSVMVSATTSLQDFEVYATDHAKKIILINTSFNTDQHAVIDLAGISSGRYSAWTYQRGMDPTNFTAGPQFQAPVAEASNAWFTHGQVSIEVPWMSVAVITLK